MTWVAITIPSRTYVGVPMSILHAGLEDVVAGLDLFPVKYLSAGNTRHIPTGICVSSSNIFTGQLPSLSLKLLDCRSLCHLPVAL